MKKKLFVCIESILSPILFYTGSSRRFHLPQPRHLHQHQTSHSKVAGMYLLRSKAGHSDQRDDNSSTVSISQQDTDALRKELADLKHELKVKKAKISSQHQMLRELGDIEERWTRKIEGLNGFIDISMRDSAPERYYLLAAENRLLRREQNALKMEFAKSEAELVETKAELDETRQSQISATESLRKVQEMAFQLQDPQEWAPESYDTISRNLDRLHGDASTWCKEHGRQTDYFKHCRDFFQSEDWHNTMRYDTGIFSTARNLPRLILEATLMDYIYKEIFANPFFFLRWRLQMNMTEGNDDPARVREFCKSLEETLRDVTRGKSCLKCLRSIILVYVFTDIPSNDRRYDRGQLMEISFS